MCSRKILIVDDDEDLSMIVKDLLSNYKYEVDWADNVFSAYDKMEEQKYDLLILDINMPCENGLNFCHDIRKISSIPIIFLSARDSDVDRVRGLDCGGDDYVGKPFSSMELLSRVNSLMRRAYGMNEREKTIIVGELEINPVMRSVKKRGREIKLSLKEFDVLYCLAQNANSVVNKDTLMNEVWGVFHNCEPSTLSVHIRWIREKIEDDPTEPRYIKTVWRVGYSLCDEESL